MRRRRAPNPGNCTEALESVSSFRSLESLIEHGLLERVCELLPALEVGRVTSASETMQVFAKEVVPRLIATRCRPGLSLQAAHASEVAVFADWMQTCRRWHAGPNTSKPYNVAKEDSVTGDDGSWIFLEGGTDWLGFQGLYCNFTGANKPRWVSFRLCLETLDVSGGFFVLSADRRTWGLQPLIFIFNYRGNDMPWGKRSFALQTQAVPMTGDLHVLQLEEAEILASVPYEISVHLDWAQGLLELFIDGVRVLHNIPFQADLVPRYIGLYNWRSRASCGFSEIMVGNARPYPLARSPQHAWRVSERQQGTSSWGRQRIWSFEMMRLATVCAVVLILMATFVRILW